MQQKPTSALASSRYISKILVLELSLVKHASLITPDLIRRSILAVSPTVHDDHIRWRHRWAEAYTNGERATYQEAAGDCLFSWSTQRGVLRSQVGSLALRMAWPRMARRSSPSSTQYWRASQLRIEIAGRLV